MRVAMHQKTHLPPTVKNIAAINVYPTEPEIYFGGHAEHPTVCSHGHRPRPTPRTIKAA